MATELRQRKPDASKQQDAEKTTTIGDTAEKYVDALGVMAPDQLKPYFKAAVPFARIIAEIVQACIPIIAQLRSVLMEIWIYLKPYKPELLLPAFFGLILCFFGGSFLTLIAAAEAYKMCSHETIMKCIEDLTVEFNLVLESNNLDDKVQALLSHS